MSVQLARYLKDFSAPQRRPMRFDQAAFAAAGDFPALDAPTAAPAEPAVDVAAERDEAFAEGRAEAESELLERHKAEIAALEAAHKAALDAERSAWEDKFAGVVADKFTAMTATLADLVATNTAGVLSAVLDDVLAEKAVDNLATMIRSGLSAGDGLTVTVKGPSRLFELLKKKFPDQTPVFQHIEAEDLDLAVEFGETVLVTRLAAWADTVRKVLA